MVIYPFSKRFVSLPSFILSSVNALAIPIVYKAMNCDFDIKLMLPLFVSYLTYTKVYEGVYSFQDLKGDLKLNLHSFARKYCHENGKNVIGFLMITSITSLGICGSVTNQNWLYYLSLLIGTAVYFKDYNQLNTMDQKVLKLIFKRSINFAVIIFIGIVLSNYFKS